MLKAEEVEETYCEGGFGEEEGKFVNALPRGREGGVYGDTTIGEAEEGEGGFTLIFFFCLGFLSEITNSPE